MTDTVYFVILHGWWQGEISEFAGQPGWFLSRQDAEAEVARIEEATKRYQEETGSTQTERPDILEFKVGPLEFYPQFYLNKYLEST